MSRGIPARIWIAFFKIKVTVKVQSESASKQTNKQEHNNNKTSLPVFGTAEAFHNQNSKNDYCYQRGAIRLLLHLCAIGIMQAYINNDVTLCVCVCVCARARVCVCVCVCTSVDIFRQLFY